MREDGTPRVRYEGFEVYTAPDGEAGLIAAKKYQPHLVLLDITMPGVDGFEVCRRLRLLDDIAIIMLTARDDVADKVNALGLGADNYVPKPFSFDELVARIRAVLRRIRGVKNCSPIAIWNSIRPPTKYIAGER